MNHMDIKGRIIQSLRPRRDGVLLRSDVSNFGSSTQVSVALKTLVEQRLIERLGHGIYAKPAVVARVGKQALLEQVAVKTQHIRSQSRKRNKTLRLTPIAKQVLALAKQEGVTFSPIFVDRWANSVTRLSGDEVKSDATDDLLVALTRAGKLTPSDMVKLVMAHHRSLAHV
jgi:DNA-binding MarR family transcriptional regulator